MKFLFLISSLLFLSNAFAHGENKYGPHMGYIRMPGTFHTELVHQKDGSFFVYLLDLQNKNPTTNDSAVELVLNSAGKKGKYDCMIMGEFFHCSNKNLSAENGQIIVKAKRLGIQAKEAVYNLPLRLEGAGKKDHDMYKMK